MFLTINDIFSTLTSTQRQTDRVTSWAFELGAKNKLKLQQHSAAHGKMNVFDLFSVKYNNSQLSWLNIILQRQSFSCWWLPQVTEPRRVRTDSGPGDSGSSGHARVRSQRSRRTLSWSHSLCLATRFYRGPQIRSHPSWRFVTHACWTFVTVFTALLLFSSHFAVCRCSSDSDTERWLVII